MYSRQLASSPRCFTCRSKFDKTQRRSVRHRSRIWCRASVRQRKRRSKTNNVIPLLLKANAGADALTEEERARLHFWFIMTFRRFEGVYFQRDLGIVDADVIDGFERSHIAILASKSAQEWWANSKEIFNSGFVSYLEELLEKGTPKSLHPVFRID
jgi:hypothetical protein